MGTFTAEILEEKPEMNYIFFKNTLFLDLN